MRHAIRKHLRDFLAIVAMAAIGIGIGGYLLTNQRLRLPLLDDDPFEVWVELDNAQGVTPGQGQTVRVAGMRVGDIGAVELEDGKAMVRLDLDSEHDELVRADASALLRPRTGLKDMFLELDPGSRSKPALEQGDTVSIASTAPDVNADEILAMLDTDTRDYLRLLINGVGKGLDRRGGDLREVFRRLGPLHRDLALLNREVVKRKRNLSRLVHNYGLTVSRLGREDEDLRALVANANTVFARLAREDEQISLAVERLPSALRETEAALVSGRGFAQVARPAFEQLRPALRQLNETNPDLLALAQTGEPVLRTRVRPFARSARPFVDDLGPAARDLSQASPDLRKSIGQLNRLFNMGAYNPGGAEPLSGDPGTDSARDEGLLFWAAWLAHNGNSLFSTADASGPFRRIILYSSCAMHRANLEQLGATAAIAEGALGLGPLLDDPTLCPPE